jgi:hypothetical protein
MWKLLKKKSSNFRQSFDRSDDSNRNSNRSRRRNADHDEYDIAQSCSSLDDSETNLSTTHSFSRFGSKIRMSSSHDAIGSAGLGVVVGGGGSRPRPEAISR